MEASTWLDSIPGARTAYDFVVEQVSRFNLIGLQDIPGYEALLSTLGPRVLSSQDTELQRLYSVASQRTGTLKSGWRTLDEKIKSVLAQLRSVGLGAVPFAVIASIAAALIAVAGGLYIFFGSAEQNADAIRDLVTRAVANGLISEADAIRILQQGGGGGLGNIGLLGVGLLAVAGVMVFKEVRR